MILFLDYDGVVNTLIWEFDSKKNKHICRYKGPSDNEVNNYQAVQWISELCQKYNIDIVVTSSWRMSHNYKECLINGGLREGINIIGRTDSAENRESEIMQYLAENPEIGDQFIIIDDDIVDMGLFKYDNDKHFIKCDTDTGFGYREFQEAKRKVEALMKTS